MDETDAGNVKIYTDTPLRCQVELMKTRGEIKKGTPAGPGDSETVKKGKTKVTPGLEEPLPNSNGMSEHNRVHSDRLALTPREFNPNIIFENLEYENLR